MERVLTSKLLDAREAVINKCIEILTVYRKELLPGANPGQLMLPETLKSLPQYTLALIKNVLLRVGGDVRPDERTFYMMLARCLSVPSTVAFLYPRLFALHNMPAEAGTQDPNTKLVILPPQLPLASDKLDRKGIYLLEDGQMIVIWVARQAEAELVVKTKESVEETFFF